MQFFFLFLKHIGMLVLSIKVLLRHISFQRRKDSLYITHIKWHYSFINSSMALQPFIRPWPLLQFHNLFYTDQTVGFLERVISPSQGRYLHTEQHRHITNAHRHPCLEWDSNPRSQRSSERRQFMS
jgi:hypothetical protein